MKPPPKQMTPARKILLVEPFGRREGHPSVDARFMAQAFADAGSDVTLVTFEGVLGNWLEKDGRIRHLSVLAQRGLFTPLIRSSFRLLRSVVLLRQLELAYATFFTLLLAFRLNRRQRYHVIHVVDSSMPPWFLLAFACATRNRSLVHSLYGIPEGKDFLQNWRNKLWTYLRRRDFAFLKRLLLAKFENSKLTVALQRFLYHRATSRNRLALVCYSRADRNMYSRKIFYEDVLCTAPPVRSKPRLLSRHEARQQLGLPGDEKILLSFGVNHDMKNYEVVFQAVQGLPQDFKLFFAGSLLPDSPKQNDPRRLAQQYGWQDNTIIVDKYIQEEALYYFFAADAIILSYRKEFLSYSSVMLYAAQCNLPVIASASDGGQMGEDVKDYNLGLTFIPEHPGSLQEAILSFLRLSKKEKEAMKEGLQKFASSYSQEEMAKEHLKLYEGLLRGRHEG